MKGPKLHIVEPIVKLTQKYHNSPLCAQMAMSHIWIPTLREVDLEPSAQGKIMGPDS